MQPAHQHRYAPAKPLPPYAYVPGHDLPHPVNDPTGHLYAHKDQPHEPPISSDVLANAKKQYGDVEPLYDRALKICERALGPNHPDTLQVVQNLAKLCGSLRKYDRAESLYKRVLKSGKRFWIR